MYKIHNKDETILLNKIMITKCLHNLDDWLL